MGVPCTAMLGSQRGVGPLLPFSWALTEEWGLQLATCLLLLCRVPCSPSQGASLLALLGCLELLSVLEDCMSHKVSMGALHVIERTHMVGSGLLGCGTKVSS